jgi:hypothetical protein
VLSWGAAGAYFRSIPPLFEAKAALKTSDLNRAAALLHNPELRLAAGHLLTSKELESSEDAALSGSDRVLTGAIELRPLPAEGALEIAYRTTERSHAVEELTALVEAFMARQTVPAAAPDAAHARELEQEQTRLASELELQRTQLADLDERRSEEPRDEATRAVTLERVKTVSRVVAEARLARLEAEEQFVQIRDDLERRTPLDLILARLADGSARELVRTSLSQLKLASELEQQKTVRAQLAAVYGRRHPVLVKHNEQIDALARRITVPVTGEGLAAVEAGQREWLVSALTEQLAQCRLKEQDLQEQLELEQSVLSDQSHLDQERARVQSRLATLEQAQSELAERITAARQAPRPAPPAIFQHPWLTPDAVSPSLPVLLLIGTGVGLSLGLVLAGLLGRNLEQRQRGPGPAPATKSAAALRRASLQERRQLRLARLQQSQT